MIKVTDERIRFAERMAKRIGSTWDDPEKRDVVITTVTINVVVTVAIVAAMSFFRR